MNNQPHSKRVYQYDLNGNFINQFESIREAAFFLKVVKSNIKLACEGKNIQSQNFYFTYEYRLKLDKDSIPYFKKNSKRIICKFDLDGKYLGYYLSIREAAKKNNVNHSAISNCLVSPSHTCGNFIWIRNLHRDLTEQEKLIYLPQVKKVYQYDLNGNFIDEYESIQDAANKLKIEDGGIWSVLTNYKNIKKYKTFIFSYEKKNKIEPYIKAKSSLSKKVYQYDMDGNFVAEYQSANQASNLTKINIGGICACCLKQPKYYSAGGYIWRYADDVKNKRKLSKKQIIIPSIKRQILQYDLDGNFIKEYESITQACIENNIKNNALGCCLSGLSKTSGGYKWKYKDKV